MRQRTRTWRRRGEAAARWGLTLLPVLLVGMTVASGWCYCYATHWSPSQGGQASTYRALYISRGSCFLLTRPTSIPYDQILIPRDIGIGSIADLRRQAAATSNNSAASQFRPFALWKFSARRRYVTFALTYPIVAMAMPTVLLWYRRIRRRNRRGVCVECGYALAGLGADAEGITCPECGTITPAARVGGRAPMLKTKTP